LCLLEKVFPPSFFDLMMHPIIHLVDEFHICGHVHIHWMYPIECAMKDLKAYMKNMCKLERSMAKKYIFYGALGLYIEYMQNFGAISRCIWDANEEEGVVGEVFEG